jgi:uncharacterized protein YggT (Ycf19 family)
MATERKERVQVVDEGGFERGKRVVEYSRPTYQVVVSRVIMLVWLVTAVISGLIGLRFVLKLIAANPQNAFANFIYDITAIFVNPFLTLTNAPTADNGTIIEISSLIAIAVYLLAAAVIVALIRIVLSGKGGVRRVTTYQRDED